MQRYVILILFALGLSFGLAACNDGAVDLGGNDSENAAGDGDSTYMDGEKSSDSDAMAPVAFYPPMLSDPAFLPKVFGPSLSSPTLDFGASLTLNLPAQSVYVPLVFDALPGARINVSVSGAEGLGIGLALYGPRGVNGLWGAAIASSSPSEGLLLLGEVPIHAYGHYLLLIISPGLADAKTLTLSLGCRGRCGEPPCPDSYLTCQSYCEAGFKTDANGCTTCECTKPNAACSNDSDCAAENTCLNGYCTSRGTSPQIACTSDAECGSGNSCKNGYCVAAGSENNVSCKSDAECKSGELCQNGSCSAQNVGDGCQCQNDSYAPVCDTEGLVYSNLCEANCKGATLASDQTNCNVASSGCTLDSDCQADQVCRSGVCQAAKDCSCDGSFVPVCGTDGKTYSNTCELACQGVALLHEGVCQTQGDCAPVCLPDSSGTYTWLNSCTGALVQNTQCKPECKASCQSANTRSEGWYNSCDGSLVAYADCATGCGCSTVSDPVCGTDGRTYNNACEANCAKVDVAYKSVCDTKFYGCAGSADCPTGQVCVNPCTDPTAANCTGTCQAASDSQSCKSDADCASGQSCVPLEGGYNGAGTCQTNDCVPSGCFLELCTGYAMASACQYDPLFDCLALRKCRKDAATGTCGWQDDAAYAACISTVKAAPSCGKDDDCALGQICSEGVCRRAECSCPDTPGEVCAETTFANICLASCAGAQVTHGGACP